jgi:hypothetical protein
MQLFGCAIFYSGFLLQVKTIYKNVGMASGGALTK